MSGGVESKTVSEAGVREGPCATVRFSAVGCRGDAAFWFLDGVEQPTRRTNKQHNTTADRNVFIEEFPQLSLALKSAMMRRETVSVDLWWSETGIHRK
jgi:hypothetical protein